MDSDFLIYYKLRKITLKLLQTKSFPNVQKKTYETNKTIVSGIDSTWSANLLDVKD